MQLANSKLWDLIIVKLCLNLIVFAHDNLSIRGQYVKHYFLRSVIFWRGLFIQMKAILSTYKWLSNEIKFHDWSGILIEIHHDLSTSVHFSCSNNHSLKRLVSQIYFFWLQNSLCITSLMEVTTAQTWEMVNLCLHYCQIKKFKLVSESMDAHVSFFVWNCVTNTTLSKWILSFSCFVVSWTIGQTYVHTLNRSTCWSKC